ncbi:MAG: DUF3306 domain-containing protein [Betaproteobacteria bacterium]|nr:DUF3306 domain-containing protein [Betaproteobacteria bacterium]
MSDSVKSGGQPAADESFLSRWSRRKTEEKSATVSVAGEMENPSIGAPSGAKVPGTPLPERTLAPEEKPATPLPDIESLTHEADFSPFMAKDVDPGMRNQAMKKLFADPHYRFDNMDKLDIYIDDYTKSDPIPLEIMKKMYQSRALSLFDDEEEKEKSGVDSNATDAAAPLSADADKTPDSAPALPPDSAGPPSLDKLDSVPEKQPLDDHRQQ